MRLVASVRTAGVCCLVVGLALGSVGTSATSASAQSDDALVAAADLIGFVPQDVRYQCTIDPTPQKQKFGSAAASVRVGLLCPGSDGVNFVEYFLFSSDADLIDAYAQAVGNSGSQPVRSTDGNCPSDGTWDFSGTIAGRVGCYYSSTSADPSTGVVSAEPEYVVRMWTYDNENILGWAAMAPGNTDAVTLQTWWNNKAGPLKTADDVAGVVSSGSERARFQRALRAHIPATTRKTCTSIDLSDPTASGADLYDSRLWIRAAVTCRTTGGADSVVYESIAPGAVDGFFAAFMTGASAQPKTATATSGCPSSGTWSQGKGSRKHVVGQFACFFNSDSSNSPEYAEYAWSHRKLGIIAHATNDNDDPNALVGWWNSSKSGPA